MFVTEHEENLREESKKKRMKITNINGGYSKIKQQLAEAKPKKMPTDINRKKQKVKRHTVSVRKTNY